MNDHTRWRSVRTVNLHLASPVRSRWWTKLQSDLYLLLVDLVVIFYCSNWYWSWIMGGPVSECSLWRYYSSTFYMAIVIGGSSVACCWEEQHIHIPCNASSVAITIFTALVIRVSLSVIWWRGAESCSSQTTLLVYMAIIARVAWVVLSWEWDGLSTWLSSSESLQLQLCFAGCGSCTSLEIYQVICSSVADDTAISHVSTMEWPFAVSLWHCML